MLFKKVLLSVGFMGILYGVQSLPHDNSVVLAASVSGMIVDENGDGIYKAVVAIKGKKGSDKKQKTKTDSEGLYEFNGLKKGKYKVSVTSVGYKKANKTVQIEKSSDDVEGDFTLNFDEYVSTNTTEIMDNAVSAFKEIGTLRKTNPIGIDDIESLYSDYIQDLTQQKDDKYDLSMDDDILTAIDDIKNDNAPTLAGEVIDKTLQRVFYLAVYDGITEVRDAFGVKKTSALEAVWDEAYAAYKAIFGTADRENKVLSDDRLSIKTGSNPNLEDKVTVAFIRGKEALKKKDKKEDEITFGIQRQVIRLSLIRAFYIGVLREIEGIVNNRNTNPDTALKNQKEGEIFYKIIEEYISRDNPSGNEIIKNQLIGALSDVNADTVVSELSRGFIGRLEGELDAAESNISEGDRKDAMIVAEEALLYSEVFLEDLGLRLGDDAMEDMKDALHDLREACDKMKASSAASAIDTIRSLIGSYENELL